MEIIYNCSKCGEENSIYQKDFTIYRDKRKDETIQDYDLQDNDCPNCGHSNFLRIFV